MRRKILIFIAISVILTTAAYFYWEVNRNQAPTEIVLYGNVDIRQVDLGFRVPGRIKALNFEEGDQVTPGQLLSFLDPEPYADQVTQAAAGVESAKASLKNTEKILNRREELIRDGSISKEDLDNALASHTVQAAQLTQAEASLSIAQTNLSFTDLYAPTEGTILTRIREVGSVVNSAEPVYTVSLTSPVWIRAYCSAPSLGLIYPGMRADILTDTPGGKVYMGQIGFISPVAEFTPRSVETTQLRSDLVYRLRIYVDNVDRGLRQGMPVTVKLQIKQAD